MPDLNFRVEGAAAIGRAATPMMSFRICVDNRGIEPIHVAALQCKIEVDASRRAYTPQDRDRLKELFGESSRWADTMDTLLWTSATLIVPSFSEKTICDLLVPCSFDFNVAATKYFYGLEAGSVPLRFDFSGQVVFQNASGALESAPLNGAQSSFALPLNSWTDMMDLFYPDSVWLRLPRETFNRINQYKIDQGIPTWEDVFERIVPAVQEVVN